MYYEIKAFDENDVLLFTEGAGSEEDADALSDEIMGRPNVHRVEIDGTF